MSDLVLASLIAASATILSCFLQIRAAFARETAARGGALLPGRRKKRGPMLFVGLIVAGAAVGGFALSQWLFERELMMKDVLLRELQARIATLSRTESQIQQLRAGAREEIEEAVLREIGVQGVVVTATVAPCRPPLIVNAPALAMPATETMTPVSSPSATSGPAPTNCTEADASAVTLCATIPAAAAVTDVELFMRPASSDIPWSNARMTPGASAEQARFGEKAVEVVDGTQTKEVCQSFASWSSERPRVARMLVRYGL